MAAEVAEQPADGWQALERLYAIYRTRVMEIRAAMASAPDGSRPAFAPRPASTVSGMEVRASERWLPTAWAVKLHRDPDVNPCRTSRDGGETWSTFVPAKRKRKPTQDKRKPDKRKPDDDAPRVDPRQASRERLERRRLAAGTIRMADID
jgi:hypothetical protein